MIEIGSLPLLAGGTRRWTSALRAILVAGLGSILAHAGGGGTLLVKGKPLMAEVAVTEAEKTRGLMYRQALAKDRCMIFIYDQEGSRPVTTRNCLIPLDVAWVKADGTVVEVAENVAPARAADADLPAHGGSVPSRHFIQFPAGTLRRLGLKVGGRVSWELALDNGTVLKSGPATATRRNRKR